MFFFGLLQIVFFFLCMDQLIKTNVFKNDLGVCFIPTAPFPGGGGELFMRLRYASSLNTSQTQQHVLWVWAEIMRLCKLRGEETSPSIIRDRLGLFLKPLTQKTLTVKEYADKERVLVSLLACCRC